MKILYYTDQVYQHGGIERVLANKINYLCQYTGHEVYLVTTEQKGKPLCYKLDEKVKKIDLGINYNRGLSYFHYRNLQKVPGHVLRLKRVIKRINPDVIIQCNFAWDFYFLPFIATQVPKVKEFHSSRYFNFKRASSRGKSISDRINNWVESKFDSLVALNMDEAGFFNSNSKVSIIPNAISFSPNSRATLKNKVAISAGRIAPVKGYDRLIDAWKQVARSFPDWELHIYGDGEKDYIAGLENQIHELELNANVKFMGSTKELQDKMLDASLYVMTSFTECFPMVLLEAMACGLPVVSYDCPCGPRNIIWHNQDGLLVDNGKKELLANAIVKVIEDEDYRSRMGEKARQNVLRYSSSKVMQKWEDLFKEL
ncbi:MAG: glycosyltransferase family 4 protein [Salinivirgaceae bacterium]|nr:glycosyltransferase family 4 protein [Salinivirgaceae bacterium]